MSQAKDRSLFTITNAHNVNLEVGHPAAMLTSHPPAILRRRRQRRFNSFDLVPGGLLRTNSLISEDESGSGRENDNSNTGITPNNSPVRRNPPRVHFTFPRRRLSYTNYFHNLNDQVTLNDRNNTQE